MLAVPLVVQEKQLQLQMTDIKTHLLNVATDTSAAPEAKTQAMIAISHMMIQEQQQEQHMVAMQQLDSMKVKHCKHATVSIKDKWLTWNPPVSFLKKKDGTTKRKRVCPLGQGAQGYNTEHFRQWSVNPRIDHEAPKKAQKAVEETALTQCMGLRRVLATLDVEFQSTSSSSGQASKFLGTSAEAEDAAFKLGPKWVPGFLVGLFKANIADQLFNLKAWGRERAWSRQAQSALTHLCAYGIQMLVQDGEHADAAEM